MKQTFKRICSLALALMMIISMIPSFALEADAATLSGLSDSTIGLECETADNWTVGSNSLSGSVTGSKLFSYYLSTSDTLTITNNKTSAATLSFDFTASGNFAVGCKVTVDGTEYTAETTSSFSKELAAGGSITIKLSADKCNASNGANTISIAITNLSLVVAGTNTATFQAPEYGSYTVSYGSTTETIAAGDADKAISNDSSVQYTLTVTPGSGYKFVGWYNVTRGTYVSTDATYVTQFDEPTTIKPVVAPSASAVFQVGTGSNIQYFTDLDDAVTYASNNSQTQITLVSSGTISDASYTIPAGMTLLIPKDADHTPMGSAPESTNSYTTPSAYLTLTLAANTKITVAGTVEAEANHTVVSGGSERPYGGRPSGAYGAIYMNSGSNITLNSGATLYAWGYVYGSGSVTANSGSTVYEYMQVTDFPGGSNLAGFVDTATDADGDDGDGVTDNDYVKSFPFSQYYVQNIEVPLTIHTGATEYVYATVYVASQSIGMPIEFIGSNGMFIPTSGSITKDYDPATDRLIVDVDGSATLSSIVLDMSDSSWALIIAGTIGTTKFDSSDYILGLNSNITINVNSGTTTIGQDVALLPGVEVYVDQGAELYLAQGASTNLTPYGSGGHNVYAYDIDQWGNFVFSSKMLMAATYSPSAGRYKRTEADLKDVIIDVNGTITTDGYLYTTVAVDDDFVPVSGGASIISSQGTGKIAMNSGAGIEEFAYCLDGTSSVDNAVTIASAWLKNGDGSFTLTAGAEAGSVYFYNAAADKWELAADATITFDGNGAALADGQTTTTQSVSKDDILADSKTILDANAFIREGHEFLGWNTDPNATTALYTDGQEVLITSDTTLYAIWEVQTYFIYIEDDYLDGDDTEPAYDDGEVELAYGETITDDMLGTPTKDGYTFTGWVVTDAAKDTHAQPETMPACNLYYLAQWEKNVTTYTLTFLDENGNTLTSEEYEAGAAISAPAYTAPAGFKFLGWINAESGEIEEVPAVMPENDLEYTASVEEIVMYTLTFLDENGEFLASFEYEEGETVTATYPTYTKQCHVITWSAEIPETLTGDLEISAIATEKHTEGEAVTENEVAATCTVDGSYDTVVYCSVCGDELSRETTIVPATGHTEGEAVTENEVAATCGTDGSYDTVVYCSVCGEELSRETITVPATGDHNYVTEIERVAPTCTEDGYYTMACGCGATETTVLPATGHTEGETVTENEVAATCTVDGSYDTVVYCTVCGDELSRETTTVPATGHTEGEAVTENEVAATCGTDGSYDTVVYCSVCGEELSRETITVPATGDHNYVTETERVEATCTEDGYYIMACGCGATETTVLPATGHTEGEAVTENEVAATCTTDGSYDTVVYCTVCEEELSRETTTVPATGHTEEVVPGYAATCTEDGLTDGVKCNVCGETLTAQEVIPATGHNYDDDDGDFICVCGDAYNGIFEKTNGDLYFVENGYAVQNKGLVKTVDADGHIHYYYFGCGVEGCSAGDACLGEYKAQKSCRHWAAITNGYLLECGYTIGADGVIEHIDDTSVTGIYTIDGVKYYLMDGVKVALGLFMVGDDYYYARSSGALVVDQEYWISKTNGLDLAPGTYKFDTEGRIIFDTVKNGFVYENGAWYYYVDGSLNYAGLIWCDGPEGNDPGYYYVNSKGMLVTDCDYWISKNNGLMKNQTYSFDENGTMYEKEVILKNGVYAEDGGLYYYVDDARSYAGLIVYTGDVNNADGTVTAGVYDNDYIYVNSKGQVKTDCTYWISKTNGLMVAMSYTFDAYGRMTDPYVAEELPEGQVKDGIVAENGSLYYYVDGVLTYAGLIEIDGNYYYVKTSGEVVNNCTYWISKNNGLMKNGSYTFDANGVMLDPAPIA